VAVSRADRRRARRPLVEGAFDEGSVEPALDLLELAEFAWHDRYGEIAPPPDIVGDMIDLSGGSLKGLVEATLLAVTDSRDLKLAAETIRNAS